MDPNNNFNNFNNPNQNNFNQQPTQNFGQPIQQTVANPTLDKTIMSPTHFDTVNVNASQQQNSNQVKKTSPEKVAKRFMVLSIVMGIFAIIGVVIGIMGLASSGDKDRTIESLAKQANEKQAVIDAVSEKTGVEIKEAADIPDFKASTGYIYISEWGIKIKIPSDLVYVSYILDQNDNHSSICFNALQKDSTKTLPGFVDVKKNPRNMGCLTRIKDSEGEADKNTGLSFGQNVWHKNDYTFFYTGSDHTFSTDPAEQALEETVINKIKSMITGNIENFE